MGNKATPSVLYLSTRQPLSKVLKMVPQKNFVCFEGMPLNWLRGMGRRLTLSSAKIVMVRSWIRRPRLELDVRQLLLRTRTPALLTRCLNDLFMYTQVESVESVESVGARDSLQWESPSSVSSSSRLRQEVVCFTL